MELQRGDKRRAWQRHKADAEAAERNFREREPVMPQLAATSPVVMTALREIRHWQKSVGLSFVKARFRRVVKEIAEESPYAPRNLDFMDAEDHRRTGISRSL
ncbi:MAG: hypothetical protein M1826_004855 [Phylliscum demangeonii]|nr:MAG: hypothetical protein M1826_004855 [Phylliscum demangeonii]